MPPWQFIQAVAGVNAANVAVATSKLTKTGGVQLAADAGASTVQTIAGDGFLEAGVVETTTFRSFGLSDADTDQSLTDVLFAWYLKQDGTLEVRESGNVVASPGAYAASDTFRVERVGTTIRYYQNGTLRHTSAVSSSGALRVDTSLLNITGTASTVDGVRLYDGTSKAWVALTWQNVTNCSTTAGAAHATRRMTFVAPTKMKPGDQLVVILGGQGNEFVSATNTAWAFVNAFTSATDRRGCAVYRRVVTETEPSSYTFDLNVHQETLGALLVYRGLDNVAPWLGGSGVDFAAATVFPCPSRTLTRFSDLYLAIVVLNPSGAVDQNPPGALSLPVNHTQSALGVHTLRLYVTHLAPEAVGPTDTARASAFSTQSGMAASVVLQGLPARSMSLPPGAQAVSLPVVGG